MLPENVSDIRRSAQQKSVSSLAQQVDAETLELSGVDSFQVEIVDGPLQPLTDVHRRPLRRIYKCAVHATAAHAYPIN